MNIPGQTNDQQLPETDAWARGTRFTQGRRVTWDLQHRYYGDNFGQAFLVRSGTSHVMEAAVDSGASISITYPEIVAQLGLEVRSYMTPLKIYFGKARVESIAVGYAYFGDILGDIAIVEDASATLIMLHQFTGRGYTVTFDHDTRYLLS